MTTLVLSVGGILGLFALIAFASKSYSLNGIKDTTVGNGQHGTARWATPGEIILFLDKMVNTILSCAYRADRQWR